MDYNKYKKEELVTLCDTYRKKIDYLESLRLHIDLHNVSSMFSEEEVKTLLETQKDNCYVSVMKYVDDDILEMISKAPMHKYSKD
jgi:succinate dehydrogenase flavin-adding protein (antitoxin of CptAB toxin-antitoxin module)